MLSLPAGTRINSISISEQPSEEVVYAIVLSGPELWYFVLERPGTPWQYWNYPLMAGEYHAYFIGPNGRNWTASLTFSSFVQGGQLHPWNASAKPFIDAIQSESGLSTPSALRLERQDVSVDQTSAIIVWEHDIFLAAGVLAAPGNHHISSDEMSTCRPWLTTGVGGIFSIEGIGASFFPVRSGSWRLGIELATLSGLNTYHTSHALSFEFHPRDPNMMAPNPIWSWIWQQPVSNGMSAETRALAESTACTMEPQLP